MSGTVSTQQILRDERDLVLTSITNSIALIKSCHSNLKWQGIYIYIRTQTPQFTFALLEAEQCVCIWNAGEKNSQGICSTADKKTNYLLRMNVNNIL